MSKNYYTILGVSENASADEIKKAYRKLSFEYHPDRNHEADADRKFKEVNEAYQVLANDQKRKQYDASRRFEGMGADIFDELLRDTMRGFYTNFGARTRPRPRQGTAKPPFWGANTELDEPGRDVEAVLNITLEEAASGCEKEVESVSDRKYTCELCHGDRAQPNTRKVPCTACSGQGTILNFGRDQSTRTVKCPACKGFGDRPLVPCPACEGLGKIRKKKTVKIRIPPGINTGTKLRLAGMGSPGTNMPPGDLFVLIMIRKHDKFERNGNDLYVDHEVSLIEAIKGGITRVETLDKTPLMVSVPANVQPGKTITSIHGAGIKDINSNAKGDLYIRFWVKLPQIKTARAKKLIEELDRELSRN